MPRDYELNGIDEIEDFCGRNYFDVMEWIHELDFPAKKQSKIWKTRSRAVLEWLEIHRDEIGEADTDPLKEIIEHEQRTRRRINERQKRW